MDLHRERQSQPRSGEEPLKDRLPTLDDLHRFCHRHRLYHDCDSSSFCYRTCDRLLPPFLRIGTAPHHGCHDSIHEGLPPRSIGIGSMEPMGHRIEGKPEIEPFLSNFPHKVIEGGKPARTEALSITL